MGLFSDPDNEICQDDDCSIRRDGLGEVKHYGWQCDGQSANSDGPSWGSRAFSAARDAVKEARESSGR